MTIKRYYDITADDLVKSVDTHIETILMDLIPGKDSEGTGLAISNPLPKFWWNEHMLVVPLDYIDEFLEHCDYSTGIDHVKCIGSYAFLSNKSASISDILTKLTVYTFKNLSN